MIEKQIVRSADNRNYDVYCPKCKAVGTAIKIRRVNHDSQIKIMEQSQQHQRRAAAKEFLQSLNELENMLQDSTEEQETPTLDTSTTSDAELVENLADIDLEAFEDAVADIEQYMRNKSKNSFNS